MTFLRTATTAVFLSLLLTSCGSESSDGASDRIPPAPSPSAADTGHPPVPSEPEPGTLPDYGPQDYTYTYEVGCYCPGLGVVEVVVRDGEVDSSRYLDTPEWPAPDHALPEHRVLTIQDMIDEANKYPKGELKVDWPDKQAYPNSIFIDRIPMAMDDEITYTILSVELPPVE